MLDEALNISLQTTTQSPLEFDHNDTVSDGQLAEAVLAGDERAFSVLFERHKRHVARVISRFFHDRSDIEEFVQQSFTKAYFSLSSFRGGAEHSMAAWLTRISVNICYDEFRRRGRRGESLFSEMSEEESGFLATLVDERQPSAEKSLTAKQMLNKILAGVDPMDRIALTLVYSENYSLPEAAKVIGITGSNLKSRLFRCRNQLKVRFGYLFQ
jgi:RNA polymerase sigma-70 factor (ECF subfamily)